MTTVPCDFSGAWRLDVARSKLLGPPVTSISMTIEHHEPNFVQKILAEYVAAPTYESVFRGITTGAPFENQIRGQTMRSTAEWRNGELVIESHIELGGRKLLFRDHWFMQGDTLVMQHRDDDLAGQISYLERA